MGRLIYTPGPDIKFRTGVIGKVTDEPEKTVSGAIASFDDGADNKPLHALSVSIEPVQDLHGYAAPWPAGGGKNLIPDGTDTSNGYISGKYMGESGNTYTSGEYYVSEYFQIEASAVYTLSTNGTAPNAPSICFYDTDKEYISGQKFGNQLSRVITTPSNAVYARCSQSNNLSTRIVQFELGSAATTPTPYSNICPISGWDEATVTRTGKNLLDCTKYSTTTHYNNSRVKTILPNKIVVGSASEDGRVGTWTRNDIKIPYIKGPITITFSGKYYNRSENTNATIYLRYGTDPKLGGSFWSDVKNISVQGGINSIGEGTFSLSGTIPEGAFLVIGLSPNSTASSVTLGGDFEIYDLQVELGSATEYEETNIQQVTVGLDEARYGGVLDVTTGTLTVDVMFKTLTGVNSVDGGNWELTSGNNYKYFYLNRDYGSWTSVAYTEQALNADPRLKCNMGLVSYQTLSTVKGVALAYGYRVTLPDFPADDHTLDEFRTYLASNPIQIVIPLKNPQTVQLDPQQINTLLGENHIWSDAGDVEVTYPVSVRIPVIIRGVNDQEGEEADENDQ